MQHTCQKHSKILNNDLYKICDLGFFKGKIYLISKLSEKAISWIVAWLASQHEYVQSAMDVGCSYYYHYHFYYYYVIASPDKSYCITTTNHC